ncbi:MAG: hypothetical protein HYZ14_17290 [Bacteroidetes bacterium]|nr:hypothetical protein [Bacteroidota bacterium]
MRFLLFLLGFQAMLFAQEPDFNRSWEFAGPDDKPDSPSKISACGVGPVEFIRVFQKNPDFLLAGSISGGLFSSEDAGENWINGGSDSWDYSGCGWADFYPEDAKTWFAYSNVSGNNGKPGNMGAKGGIMRTADAGTTWKLIAGPVVFGSEYTAVYGIRFLPENPEVLFVLTNDGLFYTQNCLAENVVWKKHEPIGGVIYDMDFVGKTAYVSAQQFGKWNIHQFNYETLTQSVLKPVTDLTDDKRALTFEPLGENLLVLVDYSKLNDELWQYNVAEGTLQKLLSGQQVNFGSGHTFAVNPHTQREILVGNSTTLKRWSYPEMKEKKTGGGYHVDVEFVAYDPVDTAKIYMACHGGVYISYDNGATWISKSKGLGVAEVMGLAVSETDPNTVVIGTFHDGSSVLADFNSDGNYFWRSVNGGDALTPLIDPLDPAIIYTSTQFTGGGVYFSNDTGQTPLNVHGLNGLSTSGWELTTVLHPVEPKLLYFNYTRRDVAGKGNIDIVRTADASKKKSTEIISDFGKEFGLKSYKVYGLFNNPFFPDHLYAYLLHYDQNAEGKEITRHRLFRTETARDSAGAVISSWYELEVPVNDWIGDVEGDPLNPDLIYLSYTSSGDDTDPHGLIYALKYNKKSKGLKKALNLSGSIPNSIAGRFNLVCRNENGPELYIATRTGVYYGSAKTLKGKGDWQSIGYGLPHCKIFGLHYHSNEKMLTVGFLGRGVWRYRF